MCVDPSLPLHITAPSAPQNLMAVPDSSTAINVSWNEPEILNGVITDYIVTYFPSDDPESETNISTMMNTLTLQLTGLEKFTNYTISVLAVTVSPGEPSQSVTVRTNEDGKFAPHSSSSSSSSSSSFLSPPPLL